MQQPPEAHNIEQKCGQARCQLKEATSSTLDIAVSLVTLRGILRGKEVVRKQGGHVLRLSRVWFTQCRGPYRYGLTIYNRAMSMVGAVLREFRFSRVAR